MTDETQSQEYQPPADEPTAEPRFDPPMMTGYVFRATPAADDPRTGYFFDNVAPAAATGATAGIPGVFTPAGSLPPLSSMAGITASPATAWTTGQYVQTRDNSRFYWNGTAWTAGIAP